MGQVSVLVSVFGGETTKPEHGSWPVTYDDIDYYCNGLTLYIIGFIEYPSEGSTSWIFIVIIFLTSPFCGVAQMPDFGMLVIYFISPLCGVAQTPDCGMLVIYFISPLCGVTQTPDYGMLVIYFISPLCGVAQTPDWGMLVNYYHFETLFQTSNRCILLLLCYYIFMLHINNLLACIRDFILWLTLWS